MSSIPWYSTTDILKKTHLTSTDRLDHHIKSTDISLLQYDYDSLSKHILQTQQHTLALYTNYYVCVTTKHSLCKWLIDLVALIVCR